LRRHVARFRQARQFADAGIAVPGGLHLRLAGGHRPKEHGTLLNLPTSTAKMGLLTVPPIARL
jgi:hypothetical protein